MLCLRLVMFSVLYFWHNQIQSAALATKPLPQCSNVTIRNNPTTTPATSATTSSASSINNAGAAALLSQRNQSKADFSHEHTDHASNISTKMPTSSSEELLAEKKEFKDSINPCAQRAQEFAESRILAEQLSLRADHNETLKKERAHIRIKKEIEAQIKAEKEIADQVESLRNEIEQDQIKAETEIQEEILQQFNDIQDTAFTTIESEITRPAQWGDYFPITRSFFVYIGWREEEIVVAEREQLKAEQQAKRVACKEIASLIAIAIAGFDDDQKKHLESLINSNIDCDQFSEKKETAPNENVQYNYSSNKNSSQGQKNGSSKPIQSNKAVRLDDVMDQGIKYKQYVFVDDNGQYSTGYLESYDGKHCSVFSFSEPIDIQPSKVSQGIQQFHNYHERSVVNMKYNHDRNSPVTQRGQVDALFNLKRISREEAIQYYKQIEYAEKLATARAAARQFEKAQHPGFVRKYINSWSGKTSPAQPTHTTNPTPPTSKSTLPAQPNTTSPSGPTSTTTQTSAPTHSSTPTTPTHPTPSSIDSTPLPTNKAPISQAEQDLLASMIYNSSQISTQSPSPEADENMAMHRHEELEKTKILDRQKLLEAQDKWMQNVHISNADPKDNNMIQYMLNVIVAAKNDTTIEIAQSGLRAWEEAQNAQTEESRKYYLKKSQLYYNAIQHKTPIQSIAQQAQSIKTVELDNLLQDYKTAIKIHTDEQNSNPSQTTKNPHFDRLEKRAQALSISKKQLRTYKALPQRSYKISPQARDFMMANNINYATFDETLHFTEYQHCLTQEILEIIESSASMAQNHDAESTIGKIALENCNLAISAQQLNQTSHIKEATAITDFAHFFDAYAQFLVESDQLSQTMANVSLGIIDGTTQALQKWSNFATKLCNNPHATIGEIVDDCKNVGICLYNISAKAYEFTPLAYLDDLNQDMRDSLQAIQRHDDTSADADSPKHTSRMAQRTQRNAQSLKDGLHGALQSAEIVVKSMMNKSLRQNVAVGTEIIVDNMITSKATDSLIKLSQLVGNQVLQAASKLKNTIPSDLQGAVPQFMQTNTGELIAIAESSGENIGAAVAAKKIADNAQQIIKNAAKTKELKDKINELTEKNKEKVDTKINEIDIAKYNKELAEVTAATEIRSVDRLKNISKDFPEVDEFRKYTNDFKNLEKLNPEEVLYLNLCDFLESRSTIINQRLEKSGGLKIINPVTKTEIVVEKFDLAHSLLCEMSPGAVANRTSGGHLFIPELQAAVFDIGKIESFGNEFFDMEIKYAGKVSNKYKTNSYFPVGTSVEQAVEMIEDAILNPKNIKPMKVKDSTMQGFIFTNQQGQDFGILIKNKIMQFFPMKPE